MVKIKSYKEFLFWEQELKSLETFLNESLYRSVMNGIKSPLERGYFIDYKVRIVLELERFKKKSKLI